MEYKKGFTNSHAICGREAQFRTIEFSNGN